MKCKNCGARISSEESVCPNCGALINGEKGYTLLSDYDRIEDFYSTDVTESPKSKIRYLVILLVVALVSSGLSFAWFNYIHPQKNTAPELSFSSGSGVINGNEKVIYVFIEDSSKVEYIHGASVYSSEPSANPEAETGQEPVSTEYEYTKNIDASFRSIFFYADDIISEESGGEYNYYVQISVSFIGSKEHYYYTVPVTFTSDITDDASDVVFDHSMIN